MDHNTSDLAVARLESALRDGIKVSTTPATANPGPLGLYAFALTTFLLQGVFTTITGPSASYIVYAFGFFFGGLAQFTAGILEFQRRNTFATVAFCCYGAFWMSVALHGSLKAAGIYTGSIGGEQLMLTLWGFITFFLWLCTFAANAVLSALFFTLSILFWLIAAGQEHETVLEIAGAWGILVSVIAFYAGTATLMEEVYACSILPLFPFGQKAEAKTKRLGWTSSRVAVNKANTNISNGSSPLTSGDSTPSEREEV